MEFWNGGVLRRRAESTTNCSRSGNCLNKFSFHLQRVFRSLLHYSIIPLFLLSLSSCTKHFSSIATGNLPPKTFVSAYPFRDSTSFANFNPQASNLEIHWWANDPDGLVAGFIITFDKKRWTFTAKNDSVFALPLFSKDTSYIFSVAAIDNSFKGQLSEGEEVTFADKNGNGRWDKGEVFPSLGDAVDPDPATLKFPIANTPPQVAYVMNSGQFSTRPDIPDTTFTVASFGWQGTDIDGDNTITDYYIALNDTLSPSSWVELPPQARFVTIEARTFEAQTDTSTVSCDIYASTYPAMSYSPLKAKLPNMKLNGNNVFYVKAKDVADAYSPAVRMPDSTHAWYVKKPKGNVLIVNDYGSQDRSLSFYEDVFDNVNGGSLKGEYDVWDIRAGMTPTSPRKGNLVPPCIVPSFQETLKLFKYVFWYSADYKNFDIAQTSIGGFRSAGGKIFFSYYALDTTADRSSLTQQMRDFSGSVDTVMADIIRGATSAARPVTSTGFVFSGASVLSSDSTEYPNLVRDGPGSNPADGGKAVWNLRGFSPSIDATVIYRVEPFGSYGPGNPPPVLGVLSGDRSVFLLGVPLYRFNGNDTPPSANTRAAKLIYRVFHDFGAF